ncbi:RNA-binding transcriptional accessory protein [Capnocytophaga sp. Marseille-Q4570]|uniref:RNA-binding transcriptional accessory protein n=1 Tax=Capnocytophaga bilenii TaxID=2819369 RepID=A0ABS3PYF9_9FLAO|nr:Tex family protein [Capnocytophaga bilenii]MBO1884370.1 RNA-binding transcriptional accessory protein [Capnocytophaga bilenii]
MTNIQFIKSKTQLTEKSIENTLLLLAEGCTIPFIARYRKDHTQNLDEVAIEQIAKAQSEYDNILKRKETILSSIEEQGKLTDDLRKRIEDSFELNELEDLYLPYKKKRKTKADVAKEKGLEPLAKQIMSQRVNNLELLAAKYLSDKVTTEEEALQGASDIIAEWINENTYVRRSLRRIFQRKAAVITEVQKDKANEEEAQKYEQYFEWDEPLSKAPSHRLLAMLRAEKEGFIKMKVQVAPEDTLPFIEDNLIKSEGETANFLRKTIKDSYKRLLEPSISNEILQEAKNKADEKAISVFSENLSQLLLASPLGEKRIIAIDPGYRTGCKVVCLDEKGDLLQHDVIYPHPPQQNTAEAAKKLQTMVSKHAIEAISIGNGTASRETESFVKNIRFATPVDVFVVSEAGASVYSASKIARDEFPDYDVTVRGAVSIGRRLADPLAELVKIDPKSIGVGQYQHDVNQSLLKDELDATVIRCVNKVGVNLNTASKSLLSYVSGIGEKMAENIVNYRSTNGAFNKREELKKVPRLGDKVYQQAVAFLRVHNPKNPLDNSAVHPEAYPIVKQMAKDIGISVEKLIANKQAIANINIKNYQTDTAGELYLKDVLKELEKPGLDPREKAKVFEFDPNVKTFDDLREGMILNGIVNNITAFGCFVDIGIKESGLVHISQLKDDYITDVNEVVKLHQQVQVKVVALDSVRKRISLSMII